ncbi:MAG TPA: TonB-dependent receptor [Puia sp.]|nr:TonB-dependent receptor [Puia sp.]
MKQIKTRRKWRTFLWTILSCLLFSIQGAAQEQGGARKITGKIVAKVSTEPVTGATILVKGTKNNATTDNDGNFTIYAQTGETLVISSVGFNKVEVKVSASLNKLNIPLAQSFNNLQDVVVIGYGSMKKTDLSSAQTTVTAEDISKTVNTTIDQALQGRAAGVYVSSPSGQPGAGVSVVIRGVSSLTGSTQPLYVIDGVQIRPADFADDPNSHPTGFANALSGLNPDDIETMNILQGPSATAIFGAAGGNGVVMITTKRGKAGETKVSASTLWTIQDVPDYINVMKLPQYAAYRNEIAKAGGTSSDSAFLDPSVLGQGTNWQNALFRRTSLQKHSLSLSGGSEKTTFFLSGEYFNQQGVAQGSGFTRGSVRINLENKAKSWLKLGLNLNPEMTHEKVNTTNAGIINLAIQQNPGVSVKNPDGSWGGPATTQFQFTNPVALTSINNDYNKGFGIIGGLYADITLFKGLVFHNETNTNLSYSNNYQFHPSYQFNNYINATTQANVNSYNNYWWNFHTRLQYDTKIKVHGISAMVGHESSAYGSGQLTGSRQNYVTNDIQDLAGGDQTTSIANSSRYAGSQESYFARLNYIYDDKYIIAGSYRADGNSNFGPAKRWGYFPAVSVAWRISNENFMKGIPAIDELKLRVETGSTGNSGGGGFYAQLQAVPTGWGTGFLSSNFPNPDLHWETDKTFNVGFDLHMFHNRLEVIADAYKKSTTDLLTVNPYAFYNGGDISYSPGYIAWPTTNVGSMWNKGIAVTVNTVNIDSKNFTWKTGFNFSLDRNKVTQLITPINTSWNGTQASFLTKVGQPVSMFTGYTAQGLFQNYTDIRTHAVQTSNGVMTVSPQGTWVGDMKFKDQDKNNIINADDRGTIGNPWPKWTFGFNNSFSYKRFDMNILVIGSIGNDILNYQRYLNEQPLGSGTFSNYYAAVGNFARPSSYNIKDSASAVLLNPGHMIPRIAPGDPNGNNRMSQLDIENGSYVRIKNVSLSYNFPKAFFTNTPIRGLRAAVNVQNLLTITHYKGYDPEIGMVKYAGVNMVGIDTGRYPNTRMYTFNVVADF